MADEKTPLETEITELLAMSPDQLDSAMVKAVEANPELAAEIFKDEQPTK